MKDKDFNEITDDAYCRDKSCEDHDWRQSQIEREKGSMTLSFYCTKCLCLTFMNFNMEHTHEHIHDEEESDIGDNVN